MGTSYSTDLQLNVFVLDERDDGGAVEAGEERLEVIAREEARRIVARAEAKGLRRGAAVVKWRQW